MPVPIFPYDNVAFLTLLEILWAVVGACMGSFSSAIAYRAVRGESWICQIDGLSGKKVPARSRCPECGHQLSLLDLFPIFSWVLNAGTCRYCQKGIPARYLIIEIVGAIYLCSFFYFSLHFSLGRAGSSVYFPVLSTFAMSFVLPFVLSFFNLVFQRKLPPIYMWGGILCALLIVGATFFCWT